MKTVVLVIGRNFSGYLCITRAYEADRFGLDMLGKNQRTTQREVPDDAKLIYFSYHKNCRTLGKFLEKLKFYDKFDEKDADVKEAFKGHIEQMLYTKGKSEFGVLKIRKKSKSKVSRFFISDG